MSVVVNKTDRIVEVTVEKTYGKDGKDAFEVWQESNPGGTIEQYEVFNQANVTKESVENALGGQTILKDEALSDSSNLFDKNTVSLDVYVSITTGQLVSNNAFYSTDYISVKKNTPYIRSFTNDKTYALYDTNQNFLSGGFVTSAPAIIIPEQDGFIRTSERYTGFSIDEFQFCKGTSLPEYESFGIKERFNERFLSKSLLNKLHSKKLSVLGDSISYGFIPRNYEGYPGQLNSYAKLVSEKLNMTFENKGISGSTIGALSIGDSTNNPFVYRYNDLDDAADVVLVMGGTNDIRKGIPLGTFNDADETTFYGALRILCLGLLQKYRHNQGTIVGKEKKIVLCTPVKLLGRDELKDWANAVKEVADYYSLPVWDAYNVSGINPHILRTLQGTETGYTDMYNPYITDGTHPTQEGHEMMAKSLTGFLKTLF